MALPRLVMNFSKACNTEMLAHTTQEGSYVSLRTWSGPWRGPDRERGEGRRRGKKVSPPARLISLRMQAIGSRCIGRADKGKGPRLVEKKVACARGGRRWTSGTGRRRLLIYSGMGMAIKSDIDDRRRAEAPGVCVWCT
jgi:hypothetical protein